RDLLQRGAFGVSAQRRCLGSRRKSALRLRTDCGERAALAVRARAGSLPPSAGRNLVGRAMSALKLTLACWDYDRTRPLIDGRVKPAGIDLDVEILRPRQTFQRMLDNKEFQVSELSLASYTALKGRGECPFVAVPVALSKIFRHSCIYVRTGAGINAPQDFKGTRARPSPWHPTGPVFIPGRVQA